MPHDPKRKETPLSQHDQDLSQEIFWDLFRQNIITLGNRADPNAAYPYYHVSGFGKNLLENQEVYFFHDLSGYEKIIRENIPGIDDLTIFYVKESMQAFLAGCRLSSAVVLGIALEYSLGALYESISKNKKYSWHFHTVLTQQTLFKKFNRFRQKLEIKKNRIYRKI